MLQDGADELVDRLLRGAVADGGDAKSAQATGGLGNMEGA